MKIGFIGQGYVGKSYADNFEARGYAVVRYSPEEMYVSNKDSIRKCRIVFIAVPTPTKEREHDHSIVRESLALLAPEAVAVIKSTVIPGTTKSLQSKFKKLYVLHSPEFLTSGTARSDVDKPSRKIIGVPSDSAAHLKQARLVMRILPQAPFEHICSSTESEFMKYAGNTFYYAKVVYMNALYNLAAELGVDWAKVKQALAADPWIGPMHIEPIHKTGRGAGGHCLIKDFAAFKGFFESTMPSAAADLDLLHAIEQRNIDLLTSTKKDLEILRAVYGRDHGKRQARPKRGARAAHRV